MATNGTSIGAMKDSEKPVVFLVTWPRTASHLFEKVLSLQPNVKLSSHPMMRRHEGFDESVKTQEALMRKMAAGVATVEEKSYLQRMQAFGYEVMWKEIDATRAEGRRPMVHEHITYAYDMDLAAASVHNVLDASNTPKPADEWTLARPGQTKEPRTGPLIYPNTWFTRDAIAIIPIRNPAAGFPSILRTLKLSIYSDISNSPVIMKLLTLTSIVRLVEWMEANLPEDRKPIVVDADDLMVEGEYREKMMEKVYGRLGYEHPPQWQWEVQDEMKVSGKPGTWKESINQSTGIVASKVAKNVNVTELYPKWVEEFGEDGANLLKKRIAEEMPKYQYLCKYKMTPDS